MIELHSDVQKRNKDFYTRLAAGASLDILRSSAKEQMAGHEFGPDSIEELLLDYFQAPKRIGAFDEDSMSIIAMRAMAYSETNNPPQDIRSGFFEVAATTAWELAFVQTRASHNSLHTVDERLQLIDAYSRMLEVAKHLRQPDSDSYHRLSLRESFTPVLQDIICGDITTDTVEEVQSALAKNLDDVRDIASITKAEGIVGEIKVLQYYWDRYSKVGDLVAVPSTVRGGSGSYRPQETHDIDLLKQRKDRSWIVAPTVEVKKRMIREAELQRYIHSLLAYVAPDGTVTFTSSHRQTQQTGDSIAS